MSDHYWRELPAGLLKKTARGWMRLDPGVRKLVVELARAQNFKCAFCDETRGLIIEHDHDPVRGSGDKLTVYNIRGLACSGCNWHLGMYEADERGDYRGFDDAFIRINERDFYPYAQAYEHRVLTLVEEELEQRMDPINYANRCLFLQKFDEREWSRHYPWPSYFGEIKRRRRMMIRTPEQFWEAFVASVRFVVEEKRRNPDYEIPAAFIRVAVLVKPIVDEVWPQIEERYRAIQAERLAQLPALAPPPA
ncbi:MULTISPECIES: endonuclease domain-containing protein [unclassified Bradyrhizobium]|uniref:endonuclease domain-containing protein n=1 Tax=unclassified Bradyrhizobium TaxID=2631580 RepID=UPI0029162A4A|nr:MULTISPECIES: endonuclease domain-containing protein [unclassified Bradyrhizobium]